MYDSCQLKQELISRLENKGVTTSIIPGFIRTLAHCVNLSPENSLRQINNSLKQLGWDDVDMDYHTLQLAIACMEVNCFRNVSLFGSAA